MTRIVGLEKEVEGNLYKEEKVKDPVLILEGRHMRY